MPKETSRDLVLEMKSVAVTTGVTWVKLEKVWRSENPSSIWARLQSKWNKLLPNTRNQISVLHCDLCFSEPAVNQEYLRVTLLSAVW